MPTIINKTTNDVLDVRDETLYSENDWLILSAAWVEQHGMPSFDRSLWRYESGVVVEGEPPEVVESLPNRHLREQREGVELANGWHLKYDKDSRAMMNDLKSLIDLAGGQIPGVAFWEANGTKHDVTVQQGTAILTEYAVKSAVEVMRQFSEVSGG